MNVGVGYAISINQIKNFLGDLHSGRMVDHATLGARVAVDADGRVVVTDILENSDAYRRGLRYGDEIVSFAGRPDLHAQRIQEHPGHLSQGLAGAAELSPRRQTPRHPRPAGRRAWRGGTSGEGRPQGSAEPMPMPNPDDQPKAKPRKAEKPKETPKPSRGRTKPAQ